MEVAKLIVQNFSPDDTELLGAAVHTLRTITERINDMGADIFTQLNQANLEVIMNDEILTQYTDLFIRVNMIRTLGILTQNLTKHLNLQTYEMAKVNVLCYVDMFYVLCYSRLYGFFFLFS